jgi:hypothetical protein
MLFLILFKTTYNLSKLYISIFYSPNYNSENKNTTNYKQFAHN